MRCRAVHRHVDRLVGGGIDAQAGTGRPDLGLVDVGDLALEGELLVVRTGRLQATEHAALTGLPPRPVAGPQHADGELAVGIELRAEVAAHSSFALLLADLLNAGGRRGSSVLPVLHAGECPHVNGLGDFEPVLVGTADDGGRLRRAVRPHQAVTTGDAVERSVDLGASAGHRIAGDVAGQPLRRAADGGNRGDQPGNQQATQSGEE